VPTTSVGDIVVTGPLGSLSGAQLHLVGSLTAEPVRGLVAGIKSVTIKGIKTGKLYEDSFINTNIAAGNLGKVMLCYATLDNDGNASATDVPFGLVSGTALTFRVNYKDADPTHKFTWKAEQLLPAWLTATDLMIECG